MRYLIKFPAICISSEFTFSRWCLSTAIHTLNDHENRPITSVRLHPKNIINRIVVSLKPEVSCVCVCIESYSHIRVTDTRRGLARRFSMPLENWLGPEKKVTFYYIQSVKIFCNCSERYLLNFGDVDRWIFVLDCTGLFVVRLLPYIDDISHVKHRCRLSTGIIFPSHRSHNRTYSNINNLEYSQTSKLLWKLNCTMKLSPSERMCVTCA